MKTTETKLHLYCTGSAIFLASITLYVLDVDVPLKQKF
jgi:hypothetical protein